MPISPNINDREFQKFDEDTGAVRVTLEGGSASDGAIVDGDDSGIKATVLDLTGSNPLAVAIVDTDGDQIASFGGGVQYTSGDADASPTGTVAMWDDAGTMRAVSAAKPLPVAATIDTSLVSTAAKQDTALTENQGHVMTDDAAFTVGTTKVTPIAGTYKSTRDSVDDNDGGALAMTAKRGLYVTLETPNGDSAMDDTNDALKVVSPTAANFLVTEANSGAIKTSVEIMDDWDESDRAKVNIIAGQAGITAGAGAVAANTPRMTLASDDPAVASLSVIDDWDETDRCKVNLIASQAGVDGGSGAVSAKTQRVILATDDPAVVSLSIMDDWDETDRCKVNLIASQAGITGGAGSVAANTPRVTHASDDPVTVSVQLIDDAIFADDAAFTVGTSKLMAVGFLADETATDSVDEGDIGIGRMTLDRKIHVVSEMESNSMRAGGVAVTPKFVAISASSSGNNTILAAVTSKKIRVLGYVLNANGTVNAKFQSGASGTDLTGLLYLVVNAGAVAPVTDRGWFETASNTLLNLNLSAAIAVGGHLVYIEV